VHLTFGIFLTALFTIGMALEVSRYFRRPPS
jgi:hypothetical protein